MEAQAIKMVEIAKKWVDALRTGRICRGEVLLALCLTILWALSYPLTVLNLTKAQREQILWPILIYCLPVLGICRNFPSSSFYTRQFPWHWDNSPLHVTGNPLTTRHHYSYSQGSDQRRPVSGLFWAALPGGRHGYGYCQPTMHRNRATSDKFRDKEHPSVLNGP